MLSIEEILDRVIKKIIPKRFIIKYAKGKKWSNLPVDVVDGARITVEKKRKRPEGHAYWKNVKKENYKFDLAVIVPFYNTEKYAKRCIESIINQESEYTFQVLLINDGSPDGCKEILDTFKNYRNVFVYHKENGGLSDARNHGLCRALAEYILFVDSDDYLENNAIQVLLDAAKKYKADIVEGGFSSFTKNKKKDFLHEFEISKNGRNMYGYAWGKVYKAKLFENCCFPKDFWFEDTIIPSLIYKMSDCTVTIPEKVYNYYINKKGITATSKISSKCIDTYYIFEEIYDVLKYYNMDITPQFQKALIWQLSKYIYIRCKNIGDINLKSLFVLCAKLAEKYGVLSQSETVIENYSFWEKEVYQSFVNMQYDRWILASKMM